MTTKRTDELQRGDRVHVTSRIVRTVESVTPTTYVSAKRKTIYLVSYREPTSADWGSGNTAVAASVWEIADRDHLDLADAVL